METLAFDSSVCFARLLTISNKVKTYNTGKTGYWCVGVLLANHQISFSVSVVHSGEKAPAGTLYTFVLV